MRVISKLNNNVVLCEDGNSAQVIALGRGIGFVGIGKDIELSRIQRTFYDIGPQNLVFLQDLDPELLSFSSQIADLAADILPYRLSTNFAFILAGHLAFAMKRTREGMHISMPLSFDIEQHYPVEYRLGKVVRNGLSKTFDVLLPMPEISRIAICFVNNATSCHDSNSSSSNGAHPPFTELLDKATSSIESRMGVSIDRSSFNYSRLATHLQYLYDRMIEGTPLQSANAALYDVLAKEFPQSSSCADEISRLYERATAQRIAAEEKAYLILHINRVCEKADSQVTVQNTSSQA